MLLISGMIMAFLIIEANFIIELILESPSQLGNKLLKIGSFVILFGVPNYIFGVIYMLNFGLKKQFSKAVVVTGVINIFICFILSYFFQAIGTMISFAMAEVILLFILLGYISFFTKLEKVYL